MNVEEEDLNFLKGILFQNFYQLNLYGLAVETHLI